MKDTTLNPDELLKDMRYDAHYLNRDWNIQRWTPRDAYEVVTRAVAFAARFQRLDELCREGRLPDAWASPDVPTTEGG
jgi:hypothetical protein